MSLTKRLLDEENERTARKQSYCPNCVYNWDDKFWQYCERHQAEEQARMSETEART